MCEEKLISKHNLREGVGSGLIQANPQANVDAKFRQIVYDIPTVNDNPGVKDTCFLFVMEKTNEPVFGLRAVIETQEKVLTLETNQKGYVVVPFKEKGPYRLLNLKHPDYLGSGSKLDAADVKIDKTYDESYMWTSRETKNLSYISSLKKISTDKTSRVFMPYEPMKMNSGDTLGAILTKKYPKLKQDKNKADFIYQFNWNEAKEDAYYNFDFGKENKIYLPLFMDSLDGFPENKTHIIKLKEEKKIQPLGQKILSDLNIKSRDGWTKAKLGNYNIIDPSKLNAKRTPIEFDCEYHTIVLHHSGDGLKPKVHALESLHSTTNAWEDVGYHYIIGRADQKESGIYEGRPLIFKGSHASQKNTKKIGILVEGDFVHQIWDDDDDLEDRQYNLLIKLILKLKQEIPTIVNLIGHCDVINKNASDTCPGEELYQRIKELRELSLLGSKVIND